MKLIPSTIFFVRLPALALASVSAYFAVDGMTAMFPGAFWPIIAMGVAIEIGKLFGFHILHRYGAKMGTFHKVLIATIAIAVMALNAMGVFGYLSRAHIEHAAVQSVATDIAYHERIIADLDRRLTPQTTVIEVARKGKVTKTSAPVEIKDRAALEIKRSDEMATVAELRRREAMNQAEIGPARYLAELIGGKGTDLDKTMEWVTLAFVLVLDPFAVVLLLAANYAAPAKPAVPAKSKVVRRRRKAPARKRPVLGRKLATLHAVANDNVLAFRRG